MIRALVLSLALVACSSSSSTTSSSPSGTTTTPTTATSPEAPPAVPPATGTTTSPGPSGSAAQVGGGATTTNTGTTQTTTASAPGMGEKCGTADACATGLTCVSYYGIAGPKGPQFKSCEIRCKDTKDCPSGTKCATVADGPGQVCRKS